MKETDHPSTAPEREAAVIIEERFGWHREIALIRFDRPMAPVNRLDFNVLQQLDTCLEELEENPYVDGVVFASTTRPIFLAGADIDTLERAWADEAQLEAYLALGQRVFTRIANLRLPTVAAIHGACVGGGYELALACRYRVASTDAVTRIGLPETRLGILPAWGGSTRLPRLVGVPKALRLITQGMILPARRALKWGLVDQLAPREKLLEAAAGRIEEDGQRGSDSAALVKKWWGKASTVAAGSRMLKEVERATGGNYPAAMRAAEIVIRSMNDSIEASLAREREAVKELAKDERCRNLFRLFGLQEQARRLARNAARITPPVRQVAVVGAGVMGAGIAQWMSARGIHVILRDLDPQRLAEGMGRIVQLYAKAVKSERMSAHEARSGIDRISPTLSSKPLASSNWIIEAATEQAGLKQKLFSEIDEMAGTATCLASNTSALPICDMADATKRPQKVIGLHFFNPVHKMPLIEVILPHGTAVAERALALAHQIGKVPIVVSDTPGFLVNRILIPCLLEAVEAFDAGMSADEIDHAMRDFGMPVGPLQLADEVGLDVTLHVADTLFRAWPDRMVVPPLLMKMVEGGLLGRKAGRGFRSHSRSHRPDPWTADHYRRRSGVLQDWRDVQEKMVLRMVDESARCLEDEVVPVAGEVDLGMVLGAGFPPFRGGPLRFADSMGVETVVKRMAKLGLEPCGLLQRLAENSGRFYERES